jgi:hypothetical protein
MNDDLVIEFTEPVLQPRRGGLNPRAAGYRCSALRRTQLIIAVSLAVAIMAAIFSLVGNWSPAVGEPCAVALVLVAAGDLWIWRRTRFCRMCGARTKSPFSSSAVVWCPGCQNLNAPEGILRGPVGTFDLTEPDYLVHSDPVPRFLCTATLLAVRDEAQEIRFEPESNEYAVRIVVGNETYQLEPPPLWLHFPVAQTIKAIAGLDLATCDRRQEGGLAVKVANWSIDTEVVVEPTEFGQKVILRFVNIKEVLAE